MAATIVQSSSAFFAFFGKVRSGEMLGINKAYWAIRKDNYFY